MLLSSTLLGSRKGPIITASYRSSDDYHHGNLRQALLEHAVGLARIGGPEAVRLRDVQRMAGVSNSAAYRHYANREELLAEVAGYAMARLTDAMAARLAQVANGGPRKARALRRLRATGQGYVDFALSEPGLFRTAFAHQTTVGEPAHRISGTPSGNRPHPFDTLRSCIDDLVSAGALTARRREGLDEAAWAAVHGLSTLFLDGPLHEADATRKQLITDRLLDTIAEGVG